MIKKIIQKTNEVGIYCLLKGGIRTLYYKKLCKEYGFDPWHESPYELRKYAQVVAEYINKQNAGKVVDLGCGLGEVLRHVKAKERVGYDLSEQVIEAAKKLDKDGAIFYRVGSFDQLERNQKIDYFITLGFMHGSSAETWRPAYEGACRANDIKNIIVDVLPAAGESYELDFTQILPAEYSLQESFGPLLGGRYIQVFKKGKNKTE